MKDTESAKRIVIDARILRSTTGRYVERLLHYLQQIDTKNEYVVLLTAKDFEGWQPSAPNFRKVMADYSMYGISGQTKFVALLKSLNSDLVHFTMQFTPFGFRGKKVVSIHDLTQLRFDNIKQGSRAVYRLKQQLLNRNIHWSARTAAHIITISKFSKNDIIQSLRVPADAVSVTYCSTDLPGTARRQPKLPFDPKKDPFLLYVGNAFVHKNLPNLVTAYTKLRITRPNLQLVFVGKKEAFYERLEESVKKRGITGVHFLGFIEDEELAWLYKRAQAYVFPSLSEGFGLPGLEAMQYGCPVVSSNATCLPEVYGNAAEYFNPNDTDDMAMHIGSVLDSEAKRKKLVAAGLKQVKRYSWKTMAQETLAVYKKALGIK